MKLKIFNRKKKNRMKCPLIYNKDESYNDFCDAMAEALNWEFDPSMKQLQCWEVYYRDIYYVYKQDGKWQIVPHHLYYNIDDKYIKSEFVLEWRKEHYQFTKPEKECEIWTTEINWTNEDSVINMVLAEMLNKKIETILQ